MSAEDLPASANSRLAPSLVAALYAEHSDELRRFLLGVLRDPALAADALQAAFAKLAERGHEAAVSSRKAWIFRVAFHEALALKRKATTADKHLRQLVWQTETSTPADQLVQNEDFQAVRQALAELRPEEQEVVKRRIHDDQTFAQIAAQLDIPLGTALGRMRTALQKLRLKLDDTSTHE